MIIRGISLIMAAITVSVYLLSRSDPGGALFLFISGNLLVNMIALGLTAVMVRLSFMRKKFTRRWSFGAAAAGAVVLGVFGAAGILYPGVDYSLYNMIKPLDYLVMIEAAVVLGICALTYEHLPLGVRVPGVIFASPAHLKNRLATWLSKPVSAPSRQWHSHA